MYTVFPAVYYAAAHFLECLSKYEVYPQIGLTLIRNEENGEETETVLFEGISFGKAGQAHARLNAAAPFSLIEEASKRLVETFKV